MVRESLCKLLLEIVAEIVGQYCGCNCWRKLLQKLLRMLVVVVVVGVVVVVVVVVAKRLPPLPTSLETDPAFADSGFPPKPLRTDPADSGGPCLFHCFQSAAV